MKSNSVRENVKAIALLKKRSGKFIRDMSSADYHSLAYTFSSTQLKDLLDDTDYFIRKHINKTIEREENDAFDLGTYFHTSILEPQKIKMECVVFPGKIRRGKEWELFKKKHIGKAIITDTQKTLAEGIIDAVKNSPVAHQYLQGQAEVSLITEIWVFDQFIFSPAHNKILKRDSGWEHAPHGLKDQSKRAYIIFVKVRADMLGSDFISDLKSTTGNARSNKAMRIKISDYNYDLSASLYLDMFSLVRPAVTDFIWIFASKDYRNSRSYKATKDNIRVGRAKFMKALFKMRELYLNKWQTVDFLDELEPNHWDREYLKDRDEDLL